MLAEAGNGGWDQQQLQQRPSKPLPLPANASDGRWQRQLWRRQLSGPTPLPAKAGDGGGSSSSLYVSMGLKGRTMSLRSTPQESILENATKVQPFQFRKARAVKSLQSVPKMWADKRYHAGNDLCDWRLCQFAGRSLRTICPP